MPLGGMTSFIHRKLFYITAKGDGQKLNFKKWWKAGKKGFFQIAIKWRTQ